MLTLVVFLLLIVLIGGVLNMIDLSALVNRVDSFVAVVEGIQSDYEALKARIADLEGQIDPNLQSEIDAEVAKLDARFSELTALDESYPEAPTQPPVES